MPCSMSQSRYDDYFFQITEEFGQDRLFILVIYDIVDNKRRLKFAKTMQGYGKRVQKSAFEALLSKNKYEKLVREIPQLINPKEDSVRLYKIRGKGQVLNWGNDVFEEEEIIIV